MQQAAWLLLIAEIEEPIAAVHYGQSFVELRVKAVSGMPK